MAFDSDSLPLVLIIVMTAIIAAVISSLVTRHYTRRTVRNERIKDATNYLDTLFRHQQLEALRFDPEANRLYARRDSEIFEIPSRERKAVSVDSFVGLTRAEMDEAYQRLFHSKRYQIVDWHDNGHELKELRLRPEFLHEFEERDR